VDTVIATVGVATADVTIVAAGVDRASDSISVLEGAAGVAGVAVGKRDQAKLCSRGAVHTAPRRFVWTRTASGGVSL
jgi:hypothetical protein